MKFCLTTRSNIFKSGLIRKHLKLQFSLSSLPCQLHSLAIFHQISVKKISIVAQLNVRNLRGRRFRKHLNLTFFRIDSLLSRARKHCRLNDIRFSDIYQIHHDIQPKSDYLINFVLASFLQFWENHVTAGASISAIGGGISAFITKTFLDVHKLSLTQLNGEFRQPVLNDNILMAQRLSDEVDDQDVRKQ